MEVVVLLRLDLSPMTVKGTGFLREKRLASCDQRKTCCIE
jgi:hypothetical protein